jgi:putative ABC transport system permease protein
VLVDRDGEAIVGNAPSIGFSISDPDSPFNPLRLVEGAWPGANEIVIDEATAEKRDFAVGDTIGVQAEGPVQQFRIAGLIRFGESLATIGDATLAGFDLATAQRLYGKEGKLDEIAVSSNPGVTPEQLVSAIEGVIPDTAQVRTGASQAQEESEETNEFIGFLQTFLLVFAGIALFVGSFVIANSLGITIAQRTREFATVRTIGASRRQVLGSIVLEALVVGILASVVGLFLGLGLAKLLFSIFDAVGFTLPNTGLVFETRTIVVALLVGTVVTLLASLRPAIRATRVPPIAAVREGATIPESRLARFRTLGAFLLTLLGFAALLYGLFAPDLDTGVLLGLLGLGALLVFFGFSLLAARFIRPVAGVLGWPATKIGGAAGFLARDNARRNPQRTASTAAALMIGLALVTLVAVLAAGITSTFRGSVEDLWADADYAITAQNNFSPIPATVSESLEDVDGVASVGNIRTGDAAAYGDEFFATAVNPELGPMLGVTWAEQSSDDVIGDLGSDGAFVDEGYAEDHDLRLGSPVELTFANGDTESYRVEGIFDPPTGGSPFGPVTISASEWDAHNDNPRNLYSFVLMSGGGTDENQERLDQALREFPNAKVQTREEFIDNQISGLSAVLNILYVLLALSVIVSLFGIVNTLVLTVFERTREIGMLRAIGMTRRQIRRMIRHESVITALIGGALGIVLGVIFGALLVARIDFIDFTLPVASLIVFTFAAIIVGILAAIFPARRAARLNVLEALQYE